MEKNQRVDNRTEEDILAEAYKKVENCNYIIEELEHNDAFNRVLKDFEDNKNRIDSVWQNTDDPKVLNEMRFTKLAIISILGIIDSYKHDLKKAQEIIAELENKDFITSKDYDTE